MKVFGIGLSRTGTTSLTRALRILGFQAVHCPYDIVSLNGASVSFCNDPVLQQNDAFTDYTVALFFKELDRAYPGSKFVLTVRELEGWLLSCQKHYERKDGDPLRFAIHKALYGVPRYDREAFIDARDRHLKAVKDYFADRPNDLCTMNIIAGEGWERLCPFLDKAVPDSDFPKSNRSWKSHPLVRLVRRLLEVKKSLDSSS